jgi:protein-disulfide isomerase
MSLLMTPPRLTVPLGERDHVVGSETAPVTIVEYGDYECPFCGAAHPVVKALQDELGDNLRFAYRHFPLSQIHPHSFQAAEAAEAAGAQNRFWQMHDMLFEHQNRLGTQDLLAYASAVGVELEPFAEDLAEHRHAPRVREDFLSGVRSGVNGTPTFFVNGVRHDGGYDLESLLGAVQPYVYLG